MASFMCLTASSSGDDIGQLEEGSLQDHVGAVAQTQALAMWRR